MIPYGKQNISQDDIDAVIQVLQSDWLTQGPAVGSFEQSVAEKMHAHHAVAVNSATSALHIACLALELGPGDWLWTSPNTFVASANCGLYCGASIDFVDIDPRTYNLSVDELTLKLEYAEQAGILPKIVVPVHFSGQSCAMKEIHALSKRYGFRIIEDASHAIGGLYDNQPIGSCLYSDITIFSFHPVKIITTGEGGMALTNDAILAERMRALASHGITRDSAKMHQKAEGPWYYEQLALGFNYRMTDIQAALGLSQMTRLDEFVTRRHELAGRYNEALSTLPFVLPFQKEETYSAYHLYVVTLDKARSIIDRNTLFSLLRKAGVGVNIHYIPVHYQPYYQRMNFKKGQFIHAEYYYEQAITLPLFYGLKDIEQTEVIDILFKLLKA